MITFDRNTVDYALELNDNIEFEIVNFGKDSLVKSSEIFKNYENFLQLYSSLPIFPSSGNNNNMFMEQAIPSIVSDIFKTITNKCITQTLPKLEMIENYAECRSNVGQYSKLKSKTSSILPHMDHSNNFQIVCNYWVNVNQGDGTQFWECDKIKSFDDLLNYRHPNYDLTKTKNWFNLKEDNDFKKTYFSIAINNTCVFYFSKLLHSPVINENDYLRCSIVAWYDLKEKDEN